MANVLYMLATIHAFESFSELLALSKEHHKYHENSQWQNNIKISVVTMQIRLGITVLLLQ